MDAGVDSIPLSWEEGHPERAAWTAHTLSTLEPYLDDLDKADDIADFAPKYMNLPDDKKLLVWGELISAVSRFESGWDPCNRTLEDLGTDEVTHEPVYSEGLLQLSYQDVLSYPDLNLPFDWTRDRPLPRTDCNKSILDPYLNLTGGIAILAEQIREKRKIVVVPGYWSTLGVPTLTKVPEIIAMIRKLPFAG